MFGKILHHPIIPRFAKIPFFIGVSVILGALLVVSPVNAEKSADLVRLEKKMTVQKKAAAKLEAAAKKQTRSINKLRSKLIAATADLRDKQVEKNKLENKLGSLETESATRASVLKQSRERLAQLTSGLVHLSREPPALFALRESTAADHVHRGVLMQSLLPKLKKETEVLLDEISYFNNLQRQAAEQKSLMIAASQNMLWQRHNLDQLVKTRQGHLKKTRVQRNKIKRQLAELASEAQDLKHLMEKVSSTRWGKKIGKTRKAPRLRAGLLTPAVGKIIRGFGDKDEFGVQSDGIMFHALAGSPVIAPQSGRVVFVGPFQGYGNIIIMHHAGGNHSFIAGFGRIDAELGQTVAAGEPLGIVPQDGAKTPDLYFEWRHNKKPVNPALKRS